MYFTYPDEEGYVNCTYVSKINDFIQLRGRSRQERQSYYSVWESR